MAFLRLKEVLKEKGVAGKDLAERVGVSENTISFISTGKTQPRFELLRKIADTLNLDIKDLFHSTRETQPIFIEKNGKFLKIGALDLDRLDEGSVPGSDVKK